MLSLVLFALVAAVLVLPRRGSSAPTTTAPAGPFYLVVGGSASLGMQPTGVATRRARQTDEGYADDLVRLESHQGVTLALHEVGCPGETPASMLGDGGGDHCYRAPTTQLSVAVRFLRAHRDEAGLVSVDLGFNAVRPCLAQHAYDLACVAAGLASVRADLPAVLARLAAAAGPRVQLVGLTAYDPFLARWLDDPRGAVVAPGSLEQIRALNAVLTSDYAAAGFTVADVFAAFDSDDTTPVTLDNVGPVPTDVERICQWTWMCEPDPFGPDNHPNDAGYMVIAQTVGSVLGGGWRLGDDA